MGFREENQMGLDRFLMPGNTYPNATSCPVRLDS